MKAKKFYVPSFEDTPGRMLYDDLQKTRGNKMLTLKQFVKKQGSQEKAAHVIGVTFGTINRWINGQFKPGPLAVMRLRELGIESDNC